MTVNSNYERLDRGDWIEAAIDLLVSGSIDAVRVEPLAKLLGVTKGSFYWHFKDRAALLEALLQSWRQTATVGVIDRLEQSGKSTEEQLRQLIELPYTNPKSKRAGQIELAIRGWARRDDTAAAAVAEVDELRLKYTASLFQNKGLSKEEAHARAYLAYSYNLAETLVRGGETSEQRKKRRSRCSKLLQG